MGITKKDLMEMLENNPIYKAAMSKVGADQQEHIRGVMNAHMEKATKQLLPLLQKLDEDPELAARVRSKMRGDAGLDEVVISEEPVTGSKAE
jgi:hypothetical protein